MALLLGAALLPMGLMTLNAGLKSAALGEAAAQSEIAERVQKGMIERQKDVIRLRTVTGAIAANPSFARAGAAQCNAVMDTLGSEFTEFDAVTILDSNARVICASVPDAVGKTAAASALVKAALATDEATIGFVQSPRLSNGPVLGAVAPIATPRGAPRLFVGVTRAAAPLLARAPQNDAVFAALVSGRGRVLQVSGLAPGVPEYEALAGAFTVDPAWAREGPFKVGDTLWAVSMELADSDIYLVEGWRRAPLDARTFLSALWAVSAPLLLWLIAVAAMWFAVELYIVRPLMTVERLARAYARGEDTTAPDSFRNAPLEIASLRRTLAAMAKTLRGREMRLTEALQEERALLREVNHRVNNNLQLVASLLSIQARATTEEQQAIGLARAHDRIQLLALAHNQIYGSGQVHDVRVDELAGEIARQLTAARGSRSARVMLNIDMQPATAPVDHAVPLAFLIGESVSQALDMLEGADRATLDVTLRREGDVVVFSVSSPDRAPRAQPASSATRIIDAFARQIGVDVSYDPEDPLSIRMSMTLDTIAQDEDRVAEKASDAA